MVFPTVTVEMNHVYNCVKMLSDKAQLQQDVNLITIDLQSRAVNYVYCVESMLHFVTLQGSQTSRQMNQRSKIICAPLS